MRWLGIIIFFLLPFNIKKYVGLLALGLQNYSLEFFNLFLYFTELLVLVFVVSVFFYKRKEFIALCKENWLFFVFFLTTLVSVSIADNAILALISAGHIFVGVLFMCGVGVLIRDHVISVRDIIKAIAVSGIIQVEIALLQFLNQKSLGLHLLGEEMVNGFTRNVAKINIFEMIFLRPYGTVAHPNILGGILVVSFFAWVYLFVAPSKRHGVLHRSISLIGLFLVSLGVAVSFSRSAWFALFFLIFLCLVFLFAKKHFRHAARELLMFNLFIGFTILGIFGWAIIPRSAVDVRDTAVNERAIYSNIAYSLITKYPFGVGAGNSVLRAEQEDMYSVRGLSGVTTHQPVHNIFLLLAEEVGVLGCLIFLISIIKTIIERRKNMVFLDYFFPFLFILVFFVTGLFDHYALTSNVGRLMFFGVLGIMGGLPKKLPKKHDIYT